MKLTKLISAAVVALSLCVCMSLSAAAVDLDDARFRDKTWDEVMSDFLTAHDIDPDSVTAGYYNTVTGEEHYLNGDQYMYAASVIKLPINMLYAERIYNGEMTFETSIRGTAYRTIQYQTLVNSDNELTDAMVMDLGGGSFYNFRHVILPYLGLTEADATEEFVNTNILTSRQIMYTLKLLYNDPDRYPGVIDNMLRANPGWYFEAGDTEFEIAHKYGWLTYGGVSYLNDCGIVYTDDPILLALFTGDVDKALSVLGEFCDLMCDYAQYHRTLRYAEEAAAAVPEMRQPLTGLTVGETAPISTLLLTVLAVAGALLVLVSVVLLVKKKFWAMALLLGGALLISAGAAPVILAGRMAQSEEPRQLVDDLAEQLTDTEHPDALTAQAAGSFTLTAGTPTRSGIDVTVPVTVTMVDIGAVNEALAAAQPQALQAILETGETALYDQDGTFLSEAADAANARAADAVTAHWDEHLVSRDGTVTLRLTMDGWVVVMDEGLLQLFDME